MHQFIDRTDLKKFAVIDDADTVTHQLHFGKKMAGDHDGNTFFMGQLL